MDLKDFYREMIILIPHCTHSEGTEVYISDLSIPDIAQSYQIPNTVLDPQSMSAHANF